MINVKYTGTTKNFEHYYGELINNGFVITEYYYHPSRYCGTYRTRKLFNGKQLAHRTIIGLCEKLKKNLIILTANI